MANFNISAGVGSKAPGDRDKAREQAETLQAGREVKQREEDKKRARAEAVREIPRLEGALADLEIKKRKMVAERSATPTQTEGTKHKPSEVSSENRFKGWPVKSIVDKKASVWGEIVEARKSGWARIREAVGRPSDELKELLSEFHQLEEAEGVGLGKRNDQAAAEYKKEGARIMSDIRSIRESELDAEIAHTKKKLAEYKKIVR